MSTSTLPWGETRLDSESSIQSNRRYWYRLESESSAASAEDTESVYSIQDKETDIVRDTSDTASQSSEYDVNVEYDIESLSSEESDVLEIFGSSGESEGMFYAAAAVAAAVVGDSSLETFITDGEDSDNSRQGDSSTGLREFWICVQCKSQNDNPQYRYCDKCFQDRKATFPPRPRRRKKAGRNKEKSDSPVKLDALKSCLSGLSSQDSGISSSSQELSSLCLDMIVVPNILDKHAIKPNEQETKNRKRQISESSLSDEYEEKRPKKQAKISKEGLRSKEELKKEEAEPNDRCVVRSTSEVDPSRIRDEQVKDPSPEIKEECIMCNAKPKNSVFLHGRIAHMCCCYGCAMRTWKSLKRCPICQRKVSNVVRVFTT